MAPRPPLSFLRISIYLFTRTTMCCLFKKAIYLVDYLFGGLSAWRAVFFVCVIFFPVSVDGSTFSSLPDGLRHFYGDHNPYSILHISYSMLYVIYDLEGSNDVNLQSTEFDPCR